MSSCLVEFVLLLEDTSVSEQALKRGEADIERFLTGKELYGDDFTPEEIAAWYTEEKEGYADLGARRAESYNYVYHAWNWLHGYRHLPEVRFSRVLGFGSAYGHELLPLAARIESITIIESSTAFSGDTIGGVPVKYLSPQPNGGIPVQTDTFDLATCLGVLHHIPNVTFTLQELARTLRPGGYLVLREPVVSMGDWRYARPGLTKHERGIPVHLFEPMIHSSGLEIVRRTFCDFPATRKIFRFVRSDIYNSSLLSWIDSKLAQAFQWNLKYHARKPFERLRPTSVFFLLRKPVAE